CRGVSGRPRPGESAGGGRLVARPAEGSLLQGHLQRRPEAGGETDCGSRQQGLCRAREGEEVSAEPGPTRCTFPATGLEGPGGARGKGAHRETAGGSRENGSTSRDVADRTCAGDVGADGRDGGASSARRAGEGRAGQVAARGGGRLAAPPDRGKALAPV